MRRVFTRARELSPLTLRGAGVLCSVGAALWVYGVEALDGVWYVAGIALLALCGVSFVSVLLAALRMRFALKAPRETASLIRTETMRPTRTGFSVPSLRFWLFADVTLEWVAPEALVEELAEGARNEERVVLGERAQLRRVLRRVIVRDVFGLCNIALRKEEAIELDVLPHVGALRSLPLLRSLAAGDDIPHPMGVAQGDRLELRRYAPGDPARFIHWKAYARTHKLVVRMPERALARAHRVAAYLIADAHDEASAALARVAIEEGALGDDYRFGADGAIAPVDNTEASLQAIVRSSAARAQPALGLSSFVDAVEREGPAALLVFAPPTLGPVERVRELIKKRARPLRVAIGIDGHALTGRAAWLSRLTLRRDETKHIEIDALQGAIAAYRTMGCEVVVIDRESGRLLGDAHFARMTVRRPARARAA